jgi:hypothetical protein
VLCGAVPVPCDAVKRTHHKEQEDVVARPGRAVLVPEVESHGTGDVLSASDEENDLGLCSGQQG